MLPGKGFAVSRLSGATPYALMVITLWGNHLRFGLGVLDDLLAILFITDTRRQVDVVKLVLSTSLWNYHDRLAARPGPLM